MWDFITDVWYTLYSEMFIYINNSDAPADFDVKTSDHEEDVYFSTLFLSPFPTG